MRPRRKLLFGGLVLIAVLATMGIIMFRSERTPEAPPEDRKGRLFVADHGNGRVQVFTVQGKFLATLGRVGPVAGQFQHPCGLAISGDRLYVAEGGNHRLEVFEID